ncbi:MAG: helicase-related protein [Bacilli bacterium]|jgi:competence protein ComFA
MDSLFVCPRCGNDDPRYVGFISNRPYCRRCIVFKGQEAEADVFPSSSDAELKLDYELSQEQKALSEELVAHYRNGEHVLVHAVTGAGKTEIVYAVMAAAIDSGHEVGLAIPRRDVVIELAGRLRGAFPRLTITAVYGGHHDELQGDIVILTTHQIYRYVAYFDLLVIDECDAFPFKDDPVLEAFARRSLKGVLVAMSATPTPALIERFRAPGHHILRLWTRYHRHPLPVPKTIVSSLLFNFDCLLGFIIRYRKEGKPLLIFVPTIAIGERLFFYVKIFAKKGALVHSLRPDRTEIIDSFRAGRYDYLISTSVLERGITVLNLQVVVFAADHPLFDEGTLLQMSGRVGRKAEAPEGEVTFLSRRRTPAMLAAIKTINHANAHLQVVL